MITIESSLLKIKKWLIKNKLPFLVSFITGILVHLYLLANSSRTIDGYWKYGSFLSKGWEVSLGRFGLPFIDLIRGTVVNSALCGILAIIITSISSIFLIKLLGINKNYLKVIISIMLVVLPSFSITLMYPFCADSYSLAMLCSILAVYYYSKEFNAKSTLLSIIFSVIAISIYQAYFSVITTLILVKTLINLLTNTKTIKFFIKSLVTLFISAIVYYILLKIIIAILGIDISYYSGANHVLANLKPSILINSFENTYVTVGNFLLSDSILINNGFLHRNILNIVIIILEILSLIVIIKQNKLNRINILSLVALLIYSPLFLCSIEIIVIDRSINLLMAESLFIIFIFLLKEIELIINERKLINALIWINVISIILLIWTYILSDNATYVAADQYERQLNSLEIRVINKVDSNSTYRNKTILLIGDFNFKVRYNRLLGLTNFDIKQSNSSYTYDYYLLDNIYNEHSFDISDTIAEEIKSMPEYQNMGIFPAENSIRLINDIVVVRIGE